MEEEARGLVNVDDFTGRKVWGVDIDEWKVGREDCYFPAFKHLTSL